MKYDYYYPRLAGALEGRLENLAYRSDLADLLKDRRDWIKIKEICAELVRQAKESAESED